MMCRKKCEEKKERKKEEMLGHERIRNGREKLKERQLINRKKTEIMLAKLKLVTKPSKEFNPCATLATKWTKLFPNKAEIPALP